MTHTHVTAPTQFVEANGIRFAYRRFGRETREPLLLMQHFRGGMDHWDPAITDGFAMDRPVILFNNAGVASSSGETPNTIDAMGEHAADFIGALGLSHVDVLGFSIGGYIAQALTLRHPALVKRLILVGTGPRASEPSNDPKYPSMQRQPIRGQVKLGSKRSSICSFPRRRAARAPAGPSGNDAIFARRTPTRPAPRKR